MHITPARQQFAYFRREAAPVRGRGLRMPKENFRAPTLDAAGLDQKFFTRNIASWAEAISPKQKAEGDLWYPVGNEWGNHVAGRFGIHPDKVHAAVSKFSPMRAWFPNLEDAHDLISNWHALRDTPKRFKKPGSVSGGQNLRGALAMMGLPDEHEAILGSFNEPKTRDFYTLLRDPETGGAGNYFKQPAVIDSWMGRAGLVSYDKWQKALEKSGGNRREMSNYLSWPGKGTGEGLDAPVNVKKNINGEHRVVGQRTPNIRDVGNRILGLRGGYERIANGVRSAAYRHDMPFAHGMQAGIWNEIGGTPNPDSPPRPDLQFGDISDPGDLYREMWARRASGLVVPESGGLLTASRVRLARVPFEFEEYDNDTDPEDWAGNPANIDAFLEFMRNSDPNWDYWGDQPKLFSVDAPEHIDLDRGPARPGDPDPDIHEAARAHLSAFDDIYDPFAFAEADGPHDNPWVGEDAEALGGGCPFCGAGPHELCAPDCPTLHSDDPKDWKSVSPAWKPGPELDPMLRVNQVLAYAGDVLRGPALRGRSAGMFLAVKIPRRFVGMYRQAISAQDRADIMRKIYEDAVNDPTPDDPGSAPGVTVWKKMIDGDPVYSVSDEDAPARGIMVSIPQGPGDGPGHSEGGMEGTGPTMPSSQDLDGFFGPHRDLLSSDPELLPAGWESPKATLRGDGVPRWYHDLSKHFTDPRDALDAAERGKQKAVYDLERGSIDTPDLRRMIENGEFD